MKKVVTSFIGVSITVSAVVGVSVYAATEYDSQLTQSITAGALSTDVRDDSGSVVASPSFGMSPVVASTGVQTSTGTFGSDTQRIAVDNPGGANGGWTLALNAKVPGTGVWTGSNGTYAYNGSSSTGQLSVNPQAGTLVATTGTTTHVTKGTAASFTGSTAITLLTAAADSEDIWSGYITGIGLSQAIPAGQAIGSYTIDMTQTVSTL